jgi:3-deoxy-D-manno-octulosonate 8-phosphate phosphatase (KDO 8-P phosphatase)
MTNIKSNIAGIKALLLDVDGVMTDGKLHYSVRGEEIKSFDVKDGLGIQLLLDAKILVGIISGRSSNALEQRIKDLGIQHAYVSSSDKERDLRNFLETTGLRREEVAYIGDDLPDLTAIKMCGFSACPSDACSEVLDAVDHVSSKRGGEGVVREIAELILRSTDRWAPITRRFWSE